MVSLGLSVLLAASSIVGSNAACTQPDSPAAVRALPLLSPAIVDAVGDHGTAQLIVSLTPGSSLPSDVALSRSSGNAILDEAAVRVARATEFLPETHACSAVGGQYFFDIEY